MLSIFRLVFRNRAEEDGHRKGMEQGETTDGKRNGGGEQAVGEL